jgi:hypothetical protein
MARVVLRSSLPAILLAIVGATALSCGENQVVRYDFDGYDAASDQPGNTQGDSRGQADILGGDGHTKPNKDTIATGDRYEIILLHDTTVPLPLFVGDHVPIKAKVIDYVLNQPAAFYPVLYTVAGSNPECKDAPPCGRFLVKEGTTDAMGNVSVTFEAGTVGEVLYTIELLGEQAPPVTADIEVHDPPTGTLQVHLQYDGPVEITDINVRVLHGPFACANFVPVAPWNNPDDQSYQKTVPGISSVPKAEGLLVSETYLVFATAKTKAGGHLAAAGCTDAIHVLPIEEGVSDVTLKLYVLTLNPAGTYDSINHFDFTDAIPGQVGEIINLIVDVFTDPGKIIIDLVKELISQYIGSWVTDILFGIFEDALADIVTDWLLNNSPDFIQDFFVIGQDIVQIVNNVELTSQLKLSKLTNDYYFQGIQSWLGINLYWKLGCAKEGEPGYDPKCGIHEFSLQDLADTDFPLDLITGQFTGMIANYDNLIIDEHKIDLNYGKLILFVINEMLLPAVSDFNSIEDLLYSIIDCQAVADGFVGDVLEAIGVDKDQVKNVCTQAVGFIIGPIEEMIGGLALDSKLRVHGKCRMLDENDDLIVDKLFEGLWWGHVVISGEEGSEFEGDFTAEKAQYPGQ